MDVDLQGRADEFTADAYNADCSLGRATGFLYRLSSKPAPSYTRKSESVCTGTFLTSPAVVRTIKRRIAWSELDMKTLGASEVCAMDRHAGIEEKTRDVGRQIFSMIGEEVPSLFDRKRWTGKLMEWAMKDENVKVQLFRFVDVLPCLKTDDMVLRLLTEYFDDPGQTPILRGIGLMSKRGFFPRRGRKTHQEKRGDAGEAIHRGQRS